MDSLTMKMNEKIYAVVIPEVYTKIIPKYYQGPTASDLPRVNGVPVSMDEYMQKYNNFKPDTPFTPDMVFNPPEQNKALSMQSIADMIDMLDNNIDFAIAHAETAYPSILQTLEAYTLVLSKVASTDEQKRYLEKANIAVASFQDCYERFKTRQLVTRTGIHPSKRTDTYDAIIKKFIR